MEKPATPLPCPFCGAADPSHQSDYGDENQIVCGVCDARGPMKRSYFGSIAAWNRRVPDLTAINAELVRALEVARSYIKDFRVAFNHRADDLAVVEAALARAKENSNG